MTKVDPRLLDSGTVPFKMTGHLPKWPQECVVCGQSCVETHELRSRVPSRRNQSLFARGTRSFSVPVHVSEGDCLAKLKRPIPLLVIGGELVLAAVVGGIASTFVRPEPAARIFVFCVGTIMAIFPIWMVVLDRYPPYVEIWENSGVDYSAGFRRQSFARKFAELNQDIVSDAHAPDWDVSINVLPKRDE